jgi:hypothetical protein
VTRGSARQAAAKTVATTAAKTTKVAAQNGVVKNTLEKCFFENAKYSPKVINQMKKRNDILHAFPENVDCWATKYGTLTKKIGNDQKAYDWLEMSGAIQVGPGNWKTGKFEYIKDSNGIINHRFFNIN